MATTQHNKPFKVLQLTDLHILPQAGTTLLGIDTDFYFQAVLNDAVSAHSDADLILLTGDLTQEPCLSSYQRICASLAEKKVNCLSLPGNHDDFAMMQQIFNQKNNSTTKRTLAGDNWQIICLNSQKAGKAEGYLQPDELTLLEEYLNDQPQRYTLVAVHHHCLPCGSEWMDTMKIGNGETLLELTGKFPNVKAVTTGHIHQVLSHKVGKLHLLGTPSTCFQFKPGSKQFALDHRMPGYRWLNLHSNGNIETGVVRLQGQLNELELDSSGY
jgi:Icc protein